MLHTITGRVSGPVNLQNALGVLPFLAFSTGLPLVSWQSLRALKRVYLFHEVRLRPQVTVAFGGGLGFFLLRLTASRLVIGSFGAGLLFECLLCWCSWIRNHLVAIWWNPRYLSDCRNGVAGTSRTSRSTLERQSICCHTLATIFRFQSLVCVIVGIAAELHGQITSAGLSLKDAVAKSSKLEESLLAMTEMHRE